MSRAVISAQWAPQRIKGLSIAKAISPRADGPVAQHARHRTETHETSLIERFLYPKFGPGQMWEEIARRVTALGDRFHLRQRVVAVEHAAGKVVSVDVFDDIAAWCGVSLAIFLTPMPVKDLVSMLRPEDARLTRIAADLPYRSFMTAGLLLRRCEVARPRPTTGSTCRSRMCASVACKSSTIGVRRWLPIRARSGSAWSISATKATICGPWKRRNFWNSPPANSRRSG